MAALQKGTKPGKGSYQRGRAFLKIKIKLAILQFSRRRWLRVTALVLAFPAATLVFPNGHAQERTIGFVSFLNQYGAALVERLHNELPLDLGRHWVVAI